MEPTGLRVSGLLHCHSGWGLANLSLITGQSQGIAYIYICDLFCNYLSNSSRGYCRDCQGGVWGITIKSQCRLDCCALNHVYFLIIVAFVSPLFSCCVMASECAPGRHCVYLTSLPRRVTKCVRVVASRAPNKVCLHCLHFN